MRLPLLLAWSLRNVLRQGRGSLARGAAMAAAVAMLCLLAGLLPSSIERIRAAFLRADARGHLVIDRPASALAGLLQGTGRHPIPPGMQAGIDAVLQADPDVAARARVLRVAGTVSSAQVSTAFTGIGQDMLPMRHAREPAAGHDDAAGALPGLEARAGPPWLEAQPDPLVPEVQPHALVLGRGLATLLGCRVPPASPHTSLPAPQPADCPPGTLELAAAAGAAARINAIRTQPTGVMDWGLPQANDRQVVMSLQDAQSLLQTQDVTRYHVLLREGADLDTVRNRLVQRLRQAGLDASAARWDEQAARHRQAHAVLPGLFHAVAIVLAALAFARLLRAGPRHAAQRLHELATLRSLGFSRGFVLALAALETGWLATAAVATGLAGAAAAPWALHAVAHA
jgi:putative ABC transport system permease protein